MLSWLFGPRGRSPKKGAAPDSSDADPREGERGRLLGVFKYDHADALTDRQVDVTLFTSSVSLSDLRTKNVLTLCATETAALAKALAAHRSWLRSGRRSSYPEETIPIGEAAGQDAGLVHTHVFNGAHLAISFEGAEKASFSMEPFDSDAARNLAAVFDYARCELAGGAARVIAADPPLDTDELLDVAKAYAGFSSYLRSLKSPGHVNVAQGPAAIDHAVSIGEHALRLDPDSEEAITCLIGWLVESARVGAGRLGRYERAIELSKELVRREPESKWALLGLVNAHRSLAQHHKYSTKPELALQHFNEALKSCARWAELEPDALGPLAEQQEILADIVQTTSDIEMQISCNRNILALEAMCEGKKGESRSTRLIVERARRDLAHLTSV